MSGKERLDRLLVERGLCESRTRAQALIMAGKVLVGDRPAAKPGSMVPRDAELVVRGKDHPFASRGGVKLEGALAAFAEAGAGADDPGLDVHGCVAMDVGASTGGFTDCLLQRGVAKVHAVDVGYGQLAWKLASDDRVVVHDRKNIRKLEVEVIGEPVNLVVVDCSFIALAKIVGHLPKFMARPSDAVVLVKPQFELDPASVGKGGIVRDEEARARALESALAAALEAGFEVQRQLESPITGRDGNVEFLVWLRLPTP